MRDVKERWSQGAAVRRLAYVIRAFLLLVGVGCNTTHAVTSETRPSTLRIGIAKVELGQVVQNLTLEGLVKVTEDGKVTPGLARRWTIAPDGLSMVIELQSNVRFHDGSPVSGQIVTEILRRTLPQFMGVAYEDVLSIDPVSDQLIEFKLKHPSSFLLESLETQIRKPGSVGTGTGPFVTGVVENQTQLHANPDYFLGPSAIQNVVLQTYPSLRTAWVELLRDQIDMLYDVRLEALDSLRSATTVDVFSYVRHYQYLVLLNSRSPALRSSAIRRALNGSVDPAALIRDPLNGHGLPSSGPVWPKHWATQSHFPTFVFDPESAAALAAAEKARTPQSGVHGIRFKCLISPDDELLALVLKRQLEAVGIDMLVESASPEGINSALASGNFEALLAPAISGPTMFRPYLRWHSRGSLNRGAFASRAVDTALDSVRHSVSNAEYTAAVLAFQQAILNDPPAIFLAWNERARAVSKRFGVRGVEPGTDIMGTLRMWRPNVEERQTRLN